MLAWLSVWSEMQTCIWPSGFHCHSLVKSRLVLPFWYRLTRVVPDKEPLNVCVCVCVCQVCFSPLIRINLVLLCVSCYVPLSKRSFTLFCMSSLRCCRHITWLIDWSCHILIVYLFLSPGQSGTSCCVWSGHFRSSLQNRSSGRSAKEWSSHWHTFRHLVMSRFLHLPHHFNISVTDWECKFY